MKAMQRLSCATVALTLFLGAQAVGQVPTVPGFKVKVPHKTGAGQFAIARVKLLVSLEDSAPVAFTVTAPTGDSLRLPFSGTFPGTPFPDGLTAVGGDQVFVKDVSGTSATVGARYELILDLPTDRNLSTCASTMAGDERWTVEVVTGPQIIGVCPVSFDNKLGGSCAAARRYVPNTEPIASIEKLDGTPLDPRFCADSRPPVDAVLVLDKSGSMGGSTTGSNPRPKIDALKEAVDSFVAAWDALRVLEEGASAPTPFDPHPPGTPPGDQVGIVLFDSGATWLPGLGQGLKVFDNVKDSIAGHMGPVTPGGVTSIGRGVLDAIAQGLFAPGQSANGHRKVLLVMSNGMQNTPPLIEPLPTGEVGTVDSGGGSPVKLPHHDELQIYSVTVGTSTAVSPDVNEEMATRTGGFYINTEDDADLLSPFFIELLQNFVRFSTYETTRLISAAFESTEPYAFDLPVTHTTKAAMLELVCSRKLPITIRAKPPGGGDPIEKTTQSGRVVLPLPAPKAGKWSVEISVDPAGHMTTIPFHLVAVADDLALRSELEVVPADYKPGDKIKLQARFVDLGEPVVGLGSGTTDQLLARVLGPEASLGDLLSESNANPAPQPAGDQNTAADNKLYNELQENPDGLATGESDLRLYDDGDAAHGDERAGDGVYSALYEVRLAGHYRFLFGIEADYVGTGRFSRQQMKSVHVRAAPDAGQTEQSETIVGDNLTLTFTPKTAFGHRLGPGWKNYFVFTTDDGQVRRPTDKLDGTYTATLNAPGGQKPKVTLHFIDQPITIIDKRPPKNVPGGLGPDTAFITDFPSTERPWRPWLVLIIFIVIVLIVIVGRLSKRRRPGGGP